MKSVVALVVIVAVVFLAGAKGASFGAANNIDETIAAMGFSFLACSGLYGFNSLVLSLRKRAS